MRHSGSPLTQRKRSEHHNRADPWVVSPFLPPISFLPSLPALDTSSILNALQHVLPQCQEITPRQLGLDSAPLPGG